MNKCPLSSSPDRGTFGLIQMLERRLAEGRTPENDPNTADYVEYILSDRKRIMEQEQDLEWQKNNMEYDLRTSNWILEKVRNSDIYAQHLYAAMCNNDFQKLDVWPILKDETWSCSWRYAGGIIADMRQTGDYIDWYCSGIRKHNGSYQDHYVSESIVTDEIRRDLYKLGWTVVEHE